VHEAGSAEVLEARSVEASWDKPTFAPADPKFAAVLDAAAEAVRASDPRGAVSEQPPAAVVISDPPPAVARPFNPDEAGPPSAFKAARSKVTQRLGSFPASELGGLAGSAQRTSTPAGGYSHVSVKPPPAEDWVVTVVKARTEWRHDPELLPESRRELRDQLFQHAVDQCFVVAVSAVAEAGDGKSRVAAEVALALAESGHPRILLMEGNFHQPSVHRYLRVDMPAQTGFSQQLHARISGGRERWTVVECQKSLHVLAEGLMRSPGLLLSKQFESCLVDLRTYYDLIVIDGPPASLEVDCRALDSVADGLLIVCPSAGSPALLRARNAFSEEKRFFAVVPT
jgi:Mrp family chromosome partitioning ATPase